MKRKIVLKQGGRRKRATFTSKFRDGSHRVLRTKKAKGG